MHAPSLIPEKGPDAPEKVVLGSSVAVNVAVDGTAMNVLVGGGLVLVGRSVDVGVGVFVGVGVRVDTSGTDSDCPATMMVESPRQEAC